MTKILCTVFLGALAAYGQTVSLSDTLTNAVGGGLFTGRVTVTLNAPGSASPLYYSTTSLTGWQAVYCIGVTGADCTTTTSAGTFAATLYANSTITPAGTSYSARFQPTKGAAWSETWVVGASDTKLYQVRVASTPTPTQLFSPSLLSLPAGSMLYGSANGTATSLTAGTNGHILTLSGGYPTWAAPGGVTSITGTANQITASASTGAVTLSLPATLTGLTSVTSTGFTGALTGNATTATALASSVTSGRLWIGDGTGAPTSDSGLTFDTTTDALTVGGGLVVQGTVSGASVTIGNGSAIRSTATAATTYLDLGTVYYRQGNGGTPSGGSLVYYGGTTGNLAVGGSSDLGYGLHAANKGTNGNLLVFDPTATMGTTKAVIQAGQGQSGNLLSVRNYAGTELAGISLNGYLNVPGQYWGGGTGKADLNYYSPGMTMASDWSYKFSSNTSASGSPDLGLTRNAAGVLEINNGTAGTLRDLYLRRLRYEGVAVTNLPAAAAGNAGTIQYVTDALGPVVGVAVVGGGAVPVMVWSNGTSWKVMAF